MMGLSRLHPCQEAAMLSIRQALNRIKANVHDALPEPAVAALVADIPRDYHHRTLTPVVTTYLFVQQVLHGNAAVGQLRHLCGLDFTDSAYCQARQRLPVGYFHRLNWPHVSLRSRGLRP